MIHERHEEQITGLVLGRAGPSLPPSKLGEFGMTCAPSMERFPSQAHGAYPAISCNQYGISFCQAYLPRTSDSHKTYRPKKTALLFYAEHSKMQVFTYKNPFYLQKAWFLPEKNTFFYLQRPPPGFAFSRPPASGQTLRSFCRRWALRGSPKPSTRQASADFSSFLSLWGDSCGSVCFSLSVLLFFFFLGGVGWV